MNSLVKSASEVNPSSTIETCPPSESRFPITYPTDPRHLRAINVMHELIEAFDACMEDEGLDHDEMFMIRELVSRHISSIEQDMPYTYRELH